VHYVSDWVDGFKNKRQTIPAILFLYFACLSPAVSFGTISSQLTDGSIGVVEFLLSCGASGMVSVSQKTVRWAVMIIFYPAFLLTPFYDFLSFLLFNRHIRSFADSQWHSLHRQA